MVTSLVQLRVTEDPLRDTSSTTGMGRSVVVVVVVVVVVEVVVEIVVLVVDLIVSMLRG